MLSALYLPIMCIAMSEYAHVYCQVCCSLNPFMYLHMVVTTYEECSQTFIFKSGLDCRFLITANPLEVQLVPLQ